MRRGEAADRGRLLTRALLCALCFGLALAAYPFVANWWNGRHMADSSARYDEVVAKLSQTPASEDVSTSDSSDGTATATNAIQALWDAATAYNATLVTQSDRFFPSAEQKAEYQGLLDPTGTGVMGQVVIGKLGIDLPIYHSTDNDVLAEGIGHIPGTSLPVGGASTHCVISGHRGLPTSELFTNIDQLVEGDTFELHVLGQTLTYEVDQVRIVLPDEVDELAIEPGEDLCTLVTCTPYAINTHRLLVRGHRTGNATSVGNAPADATQVDWVVEAAVLAVVGLAVAWVLYLVREHGVRVRRRELAAARKAWGLMAPEGAVRRSRGGARQRRLRFGT